MSYSAVQVCIGAMAILRATVYGSAGFRKTEGRLVLFLEGWPDCRDLATAPGSWKLVSHKNMHAVRQG